MSTQKMFSLRNSIAPNKQGYPHSSVFFLFLHENIYCGYSLEAPQQGTSDDVFIEK